MIAFKKIHYLPVIASVAALMTSDFAQGQDEVAFKTEIADYELVLPFEIEAVLSIPHLRLAVKKYSENEHMDIVIQHPVGGSGTDWAIELRNALVSLGIPSASMVLEPNFGNTDVLTVLIMQEQAES